MQELQKIRVDKLIFEGKGMGVLPNGKKVLLRKVLPGEEVEFFVLKKKRDYLEGWPVSWATRSADRIEPKCPFFDVCGGCSFQNLSYEKQVAVKQEFLLEAFERIGKFDLDSLQSCVRSPISAKHAFAYRNKMEFSLEMVDGKILVGFIDPKRRFHVLDIDTCFLQSESSQKALLAVREIVQKTTLDVFRTQTPNYPGNPQGFLSSVFLRTNYQDEILIGLQTNDREFPLEERSLWIETFQKYLGEKLVSVLQMRRYLQQSQSPETFEVLFGTSTIEDRVGNLFFDIGPRSFFQVNRAMSEKMIEIVRSEVQKSSIIAPNVLDFFSGNGFFGMSVAQLAQNVIGIEIEKSAVEEGKRNLIKNNIDHYTFYLGDARKVLQQLFLENPALMFDIAIVDPPRAGLGEKCGNILLQTKAKKIIYISCSPASLARDARQLVDAGYKLTSLQVLDLFPQTYHLETIAIFE